MNIDRNSLLTGPFLAALVLASLLLTGCDRNASAGGADARPAERRTPIAAAEVDVRDLSRRFSQSAAVTPRASIRLASRTSGTLSQVHFEEGEAVRQGQLLAELDISEQAAELARARAEEEQARLDYQRASDLRGSGVVSPAEYQRARATLQVAESERLLWETRVAFGRITSPRDAVITARHVEPGEAVQAQDTLFELAALDELVIRLGISELDVVHLQTGHPVPVRLDALPALALEGQIRRIFPSADASSRLVTVEIALPANASSLGVRPGFLARVDIAIDPRPDALAVPAAAIGEREGRRYVYVIDTDERLQPRDIETGLTRGQWTEVVNGLERGERVLASNPIDMREGQAVRIVSWRNPSS